MGFKTFSVIKSSSAALIKFDFDFLREGKDGTRMWSGRIAGASPAARSVTVTVSARA